MFGGKSPRANGRPVRHAAPRSVQLPKVSVAIRTRLQREFGIGCTGCFTITLSRLDNLSIDEIRRQSNDIAKALQENAHESAAKQPNHRRLVDWAKANAADRFAAFIDTAETMIDQKSTAGV